MLRLSVFLWSLLFCSDSVEAKLITEIERCHSFLECYSLGVQAARLGLPNPGKTYRWDINSAIEKLLPASLSPKQRITKMLDVKRKLLCKLEPTVSFEALVECEEKMKKEQPLGYQSYKQAVQTEFAYLLGVPAYTSLERLEEILDTMPD